MKERRTARRYDLSLPIIVRARIDAEAAPKTGKIRDISNRGVYFTIDNRLNAGSEVELTMILPAELTGGAEVLIKAAGKVIRVDQRSSEDDQNVAAVFEMYDIIRNETTVA